MPRFTEGQRVRDRARNLVGTISLTLRPNQPTVHGRAGFSPAEHDAIRVFAARQDYAPPVTHHLIVFDDGQSAVRPWHILTEASGKSAAPAEGCAGVGAQVKWSSQAGGKWTTKQGTVVCVIPANTSPAECMSTNSLSQYQGVNKVRIHATRPERSYLVTVVVGSGKPMLYWPLSNKVEFTER